MDCRACKSRYRADQLLEDNGVSPIGMSENEMEEHIRRHEIACPNCGARDFTEIRKFNLMFKTFCGCNRRLQK